MPTQSEYKRLCEKAKEHKKLARYHRRRLGACMRQIAEFHKEHGISLKLSGAEENTHGR